MSPFEADEPGIWRSPYELRKAWIADRMYPLLRI